MELRHLRYFRSVAESGGISASARRLYVSASAISETIKDLETELGVSLFDRHARSARLTAAGSAFLEDAIALLTLADKAIETARRVDKGEAGRLTIGFFAGAFGSFAPRLIHLFRRKHKDIRIHLLELLPALHAEALISGAIDLGFTRPGAELQTNRIQSELFQTERLYAVLPQTHRLAKRKEIDLIDLADEPFVLNDRRFSSALHDRVFSLCSEAGFSPTVVATASAANGVAALVEAGEGVAILSQPIRSPESALRFIPLADANATVDIVVAWRSDSSNAAVTTFIQHVRSNSNN